ncbi:MAG: SH3 domain-containing protein [Acidimicrobiales bacterium]|jgi:hypothetical protein
MGDGSAAPIVINAVPTPTGAGGAPAFVLVNTAPQRTRMDWHWIGMCNAFGVPTATDVKSGKAWDVSDNGLFESNRTIIHSVYDYYGALYRRNPAKCRWAGLARVAGGPFFKGFITINEIEKKGATAGVLGPLLGPLSPVGALSAAECQIALAALMQMGKRIFFDMAWQHEAYTVGGITEIRRLKAAGEFDQPFKDEPVPSRCPEFWEDIDRDEAGSWAGNQSLFDREQRQILPRGYGRLSFLPMVQTIMTRLADTPHPWGHSFNDFFHQDVVSEKHVVTNTTDRWSWMKDDVLPTWQARSEGERGKVVALSLEGLMDRKFP